MKYAIAGLAIVGGLGWLSIGTAQASPGDPAAFSMCAALSTHDDATEYQTFANIILHNAVDGRSAYDVGKQLGEDVIATCPANLDELRAFVGRHANDSSSSDSGSTTV